MLEQLKIVEEEGLKALESVHDEAALEAWRVAHLGRSSGLMQVFSKFGQLSKEEKPVVGQRANEVKRRSSRPSRPNPKRCVRRR